MERNRQHKLTGAIELGNEGSCVELPRVREGFRRVVRGRSDRTLLSGRWRCFLPGSEALLAAKT